MRWPLSYALTPRGDYDIDAHYVLGDVVSYLGASWFCGRPSHGDPPPSQDWWGPFVPGSEVGASGGQHVIRDQSSSDMPTRRYLHFDNEKAEKQWATVTDSAVDDETIVTYPTPTLADSDADKIRGLLGGASYAFEDIVLTADFSNPDLPVKHPQWGVDKFGIVHLRGAIKAHDTAIGFVTQFGSVPEVAQPRGIVRLPVVKSDGSPTYIMIDNDGLCYTDVAAENEVIYLDCKFPSGNGFGGFPSLPETEVVPHGPDAMRTVRVGADGIGLEGVARVTGKSNGIVLCDLYNKFYPTGAPYSILDMQAPPHRWDAHGSFEVVGGKYEGISGTSQIWVGGDPDYNVMYLTIEDRPPFSSFGHPSFYRVTMGIVGVPSHPSNVIEVDLHFAFRCRTGPTDFTE